MKNDNVAHIFYISLLFLALKQMWISFFISFYYTYSDY